MSLVALYFSRRTREPANFCSELRKKILRHFDADGVNFCFRSGEDEEESGIDWEKKNKEGVVAIVVCDGDLTCAEGIYHEANGYAPKGVYHRDGDKIVEIEPGQHKRRKVLHLVHS